MIENTKKDYDAGAADVNETVTDNGNETTKDTDVNAILQMDAKTLLSKDTLNLICKYQSNLDRTDLIDALYRRAKSLEIHLTKGQIRSRVKANDADLVIAAKTEIETAVRNERKNLFSIKVGEAEIDKLNLKTCMYTIDCKDGVNWYPENGDPITVCPHIILPVGRIIDSETGKHMLKIAFNNDGVWKTVIVNREAVACSHDLIKELACQGVTINDGNAKLMSTYLLSIEHLNIRSLPIGRSISVLGWTDDDYSTFIPYVDDDVTFVGNEDQQSIYEAVTVNVM